MFETLALARERAPDTYVPYLGHASHNVVLLDDGSLLAMFHLDGMAFETADVQSVNGRHEQRNIVLRNLATPRVILSSHMVRTLSPSNAYPDGDCSSTFARDLDARYRTRLLSNRLFRNDWFLSVLLRASNSPGAMVHNIATLFARSTSGGRTQSATPATLERMDGVIASLLQELRVYHARALGLRSRQGVLFSEIGEALHLILTGEHLPVPLVNGHLGGAIYTDRVIVGRETVEIRGPGSSTFAAAFGLREYPARTWPGMFDSLLTAPYRLVLTQTFGFLNKQVAQDIMTRKQNQMVTANDKAASQTAALSLAADLLNSNAFVMGEHHLSLMTFADSLDNLRSVAARARRDLAESGAVIVREDLGLEAAYWAQLPGNMALRTRPGAISSRNFAAMASLHNYPAGAARGHWGAPLTLFRTTGGTAYHFHLHAPTETVVDLGNVFLAGPAGSGKTTTLLFILAMSERQQAQVVFVDKDCGGEILARAVGGSYLVLPSGKPSGLAPLKALSDKPADIEFLKALIRALVVDPGHGLTPDQERRLEMAVQTVLSLPQELRSFRELRAFLGQADPDGPGARLDKWCQGESLGWVLDNDADCLMTDARFIGFDVTAFLDDPVTRGPILSYLFHRIERLLDGRRLVLAIDEFWKVLLDVNFRDLVNNQLKTIRKLNGLVILSTQSPADALRSVIGHTINEQCPTQILMPNLRADRTDYCDGLKLTEAEFLAVSRDLTTGGHRFLLKQGNASVACELDLSGMDDMVAVLSGRRNTVRLMEHLIDRYGADPDNWLPHFYKMWRTAAPGANTPHQEADHA